MLMTPRTKEPSGVNYLEWFSSRETQLGEEVATFGKIEWRYFCLLVVDPHFIVGGKSVKIC